MRDEEVRGHGTCQCVVSKRTCLLFLQMPRDLRNLEWSGKVRLQPDNRIARCIYCCSQRRPCRQRMGCCWQRQYRRYHRRGYLPSANNIRASGTEEDLLDLLRLL